MEDSGDIDQDQLLRFHRGARGMEERASCFLGEAGLAPVDLEDELLVLSGQGAN